MGYQALLFCPDEKLASVVSQVFSELDFAVEAVHEPFAAVKKLMAQRYDALVVDSENEQNASLLFKSARNSSLNQGSLAIALVEGQMGVAKAYRIGANLVLTKPINVEQAKGTLRVARGLLRKNSDASGASAGGTATPAMPARTNSASAGSSLQPDRRSAPRIVPAAMAPPSNRGQASEFEASQPAMVPEGMSAQETAATAEVEDKPVQAKSAQDKSAAVPASAAQPRITIAAGSSSAEARQPASAGVLQNAAGSEAATIAAASVPAQKTSSAFTTVPGSAAAPAPAKEVTAAPAKKNKSPEPEPANPAHDAAHEAAPVPTFGSLSASDAPSFAVLDGKDSGGSGGSKKILMAAAAVLALAAVGYLGYSKLGTPSTTTPTSQPVNATRDSEQPVPAPAPMSSPVAAPSKTALDRASIAAPTSSPKTEIVVLPGNPSTGAANSPAIRIAANATASDEPEAKNPGSAPLHVKSSSGSIKTKAQDEESAPPLPSPAAVASADASNLSSLISSSSANVAKPALAIIKISQGVSQGLLIKRVTPQYPQAALAVHAQGAVQIEATINKEGNVTNPKVLKGDPVLARAALEAVRQWRYKPYYLDGAPVEIQTQITVNFKAN